MQYHTTDPEGITEINPPVEKMRAILTELDEDSEELDAWLFNDVNGWSISIFPGMYAILENEESEEQPKQLNDLTLEDALALWVSLSKGEMEALFAKPWSPLDYPE